MNKYTKKLLAMLLVMVLTVPIMTGCQLAKEETVIMQDENEVLTNKDIFCGVFVSTQNLFYDDEIELLDEDLMKIFKGEDVDLYKENKEGDRIYATKKIELTEDGYEHEVYAFEGIDGIAFFRYYEIQEGKYPVSVLGYSQSDASDLLMNLKTTDNGRVDEITGTVCLNKSVVDKFYESTKAEDLLIHVYAVYQTREGEIYLTQCEAVYINKTMTSGISTSYSESTKSDIAGEEQEYSCTVDIAYETENPVDNTVVYEMDSANNIVKIVEIDNANIPEKLVVDEKTEYVIVEEYSDGKLVDRDMTNMNEKFDEEYEKYFETIVKTEDNMFIEQVQVELKKKK